MKIIYTASGDGFQVDDENFDYLSQFAWFSRINKNGRLYAFRTIKVNNKNKSIFMHVEICKLNDIIISKETDHIDRNSQNNQKSNLRHVTNSQNQANVEKRLDNTSGYKGVSWRKDMDKWRVLIRVNGKLKYLGYFDDIIEAAKTYDYYAVWYFGKYAKLNFEEDRHLYKYRGYVKQN